MAKLKMWLVGRAQVLSQIKLKTLAMVRQMMELKSHIYAFQDCMNIFSVACLLAACLVFLLPNINLMVRRKDEGRD